MDQLKLALSLAFGLGFLGLALPAFLEPMTFWTGIVFGEYLYETHELHHFVLGSVIPLMLLGVVVQFYRPSERVGALHASIIIWVALLVTFSIGGAFSPILILLFGLLLGIALTHPAGGASLPTTNAPSKPFLVVAIPTVLAGVVLAAMELNAQFTAQNGHVAFNHYLFMATTWLSIGALTVYSSFRPTFWRYPTYVVVVLLVVIGGGSILYPGAEQGSSLGVIGGIVAIGWAALIAHVAERDELPLGGWSP